MSAELKLEDDYGWMSAGLSAVPCTAVPVLAVVSELAISLATYATQSTQHASIKKNCVKRSYQKKAQPKLTNAAATQQPTEQPLQQFASLGSNSSPMQQLTIMVESLGLLCCCCC
jgi:hypothetical protein